MKKQETITTDELFRNLGEHEENFNPSAWDHMNELLENEEKKRPLFFLLPLNKNKRTLQFILIMTSIGMLATIVYFTAFPGNSTDTISGDLKQKTSSTETVTGESLAQKGQGQGTEVTLAEKRPGVFTLTPPTLVRKPYHKKEMVVLGGEPGLFTQVGDPQKPKSFDSSWTGMAGKQAYRVIVHKEWIPDQYDYIELPQRNYVSDFWMGLHYTRQEAGYKLEGWDSSGRDGVAHGFNWQFMSGNLFRTSNFASYAGFDWGMQFYGRSPKSLVVLNTAKEDSAYTRLAMSSMDFLIRGHWEYARFGVIPYVTLAAGPRIFMTQQRIRAYGNLGEETASSNSHNASVVASFMYGGGVGARLKLSNVVSLDARYEYMMGTPVALPNLERSTFNGLKYDLKEERITPTYSQFKFGVIFNLSERESERKLVKPGYYRETSYDSLLIDEKDSNIRYLPCKPCDNVKVTVGDEDGDYEGGEDDYPGDNDSGTPNRKRNIIVPSIPAIPKGGFPGIKPPVIKPN